MGTTKTGPIFRKEQGGGASDPAAVLDAATVARIHSSPQPDDGSRVADLEAALAKYRGKRLVTFIKGFPDPDSIASAVAHQHICRSVGVESDIVHFEELSHHENKALVKTLEIEMLNWTDTIDLGLYCGYCCVDTPNGDLPIPRPEHLVLVSLVDHHKASGSIVADFVDVRENSGSTGAIYTEYLSQRPALLEPKTKQSTLLATALMYAIRSDTDDFLLAQPIDYDASAFLASYVDREVLALVSRQSISAKSMDILQVAMDAKILKGTYLIAGVGFVREEDRDGIAEAADYLLRREGVDTVVVYGIIGGHTVDGSLRTESNTVDPDKWLKDLLGQDLAGRHYGGGRRDKGGFQIPLGVFGHCSNRDLLWQTVKTTVEDLVFEKIGASRDK